MNVFALHAPTDSVGLRWTGSAIAIVAIHAGLIAAGIWWYHQPAPPGVAIPTIMIDMAPATAAPETQPLDIAPGPEMMQSEAPSEPPPEPVQQKQVEEQIPPTPLMEKPVVEAPPEQKIEPTPPPPEPAKIIPNPPKPVPEKPKPKPIRAEVKKKPNDTPAAPQTTAAPRAERVAPAASAAAAGASRAASASYNQLVQSHLQRFKQFPQSARTGQSGTAVVRIAFTLDRSGRVLSSRLLGSSGNSALDAETLAMIRRAQPFPAFPPEKTGGTEAFNVPLRYDLR
jgi:protein TonB